VVMSIWEGKVGGSDWDGGADKRSLTCKSIS
jgi:hypothetical protein